ncbi:MAG: hydroxymethylbilane synthase [Calditrichaeota bacterium]|nr:hydroxymethylbilane synthase [Calditrichota bacterium]RQW08642.1 MAG: hydroxymethylbilane synthase [Calditrichota bacterium]
MTVKIGTRGSQLAMWQTKWVRKKLLSNFPDIRMEIIVIKTTGDKILDSPLSRIGDKGLFTRELDIALLKGEIDLAVHSMKDIPTIFDPGLAIGAVTERWDPRDALISRRGIKLSELPQGAIIATGSLRRKAQLLHFRPDLKIVDIRGNVPTRLEKFDKSDWDGMILATAGLHRLDLEKRISEIVSSDILLPAVGQGCFGILIRKNDEKIINILKSLDQPEIADAVDAERSMLRKLEGGCQVPIGALGECTDKHVHLQGCIASLDGQRFFRDKITFPREKALEAGIALADRLTDAGGGEILEEIRKSIK